MVIKITISRNKMSKLNIITYLLEKMIFEFFDCCTLVNKATVINTFITDKCLYYLCKVDIINKQAFDSLKLIFKTSVCKGVYSNYKYIIERKSSYSLTTLEKEDYWIMHGELSSITDLAQFDTTRIEVVPSIEVLHKHIGTMQAYNLLAMSYSSNGLMRFLTNILSLNQFLTGVIRRIQKHKCIEMSTISKIAYGTPVQDIQQAVIKKKKEPIDDISSCTLFGQAGKYGTGMFDTYIKVNDYFNAKEEEGITKLLV